MENVRTIGEKTTRRKLDPALLGQSLSTSGTTLSERLKQTAKAGWLMTTWRIWLRYEDIHECVCIFGALGEHACSSMGNLLRNADFADPATRLDGPSTPTALPCVVAVDAPLIIEEPEIVREIPVGAGCVLVAPYSFPDQGIVDARKALGKRPAWVTLSHSAISGEFCRDYPLGMPILDTDSVSQFLPFAMQCREQLARAYVRHRDAFLCFDVCCGYDDTQSISGYSLAKVLAHRGYPGWNYHRRFWRKPRARQFLWVEGPIVPKFRALIDALPPHRSGAPRRDIEVISDEGMEPWGDRTIWRAVRVEWLVLRRKPSPPADTF